MIFPFDEIGFEVLKILKLIDFHGLGMVTFRCLDQEREG